MSLQGANLRNTYLEGANLSGAHLEGVDLAGAHLEGADLVGAHLQGANLHVTHLQGANLVAANLAGAILGEADLWGANFSAAVFEAKRPADGEEPPEWWSRLPEYTRNELVAESVDGLVKAKLTQEMIRDMNGDGSTQLPSDWSKPVWWSTLSSSLPNFSGPLPSGEYHIKLGKILMYFSVGEGWNSYLRKLLPNSFALTLSGEPTGGSILEFHNVHSVVDPDKFRTISDPSKPGDYAAAVLAKPPNLFQWCSELKDRGYLDITEEAEEVQPAIGGASGMQFEVRVPLNKGTLRDMPGLFAPGIPLFPRVMPRDLPTYLAEGDKCLIIDLNVAGETISIIISSAESEVEEFRARTRNVLDTVKWLTQERLEEATGHEYT